MLHCIYFSPYKRDALHTNGPHTFGGDPLGMSRMFDVMVNHLYVTFYKKISGTSLGQWISEGSFWFRNLWGTIRQRRSCKWNLDSSSLRFWHLPHLCYSWWLCNNYYTHRWFRKKSEQWRPWHSMITLLRISTCSWTKGSGCIPPNWTDWICCYHRATSKW